MAVPAIRHVDGLAWAPPTENATAEDDDRWVPEPWAVFVEFCLEFKVAEVP